PCRRLHADRLVRPRSAVLCTRHPRTEEVGMAFPDVVNRETWLESRKRLLALEKHATRERDALNAGRRRLPMVRIEKEYLFEGPDGEVTLAGLFGDSRQLIVQHVMYGP